MICHLIVTKWLQQLHASCSHTVIFKSRKIQGEAREILVPSFFSSLFDQDRKIFLEVPTIRLSYWLEMSHWISHKVSMILFFKYLSTQLLFLFSNYNNPSSTFYWINILLKGPYLKSIHYINASPIFSVVAILKDGHQLSLPPGIHTLCSPSHIVPEWQVASRRWQKWWNFTSEVRL